MRCCVSVFGRDLRHECTSVLQLIHIRNNVVFYRESRHLSFLTDVHKLLVVVSHG